MPHPLDVSRASSIHGHEFALHPLSWDPTKPSLTVRVEMELPEELVDLLQFPLTPSTENELGLLAATVGLGLEHVAAGQ